MIHVKELSKRYRGKKALNEFGIEINKGEVIGILGPNGSGKSTFMKIMAGLLDETSGTVKINGLLPSSKTKEIVSYLSENSSLPKGNTVKEVINFYDYFYDDFDREKCMISLKTCKLENELGTRIRKLSKGMHQKLRVILAMSRNAKVYLLDEPFSGIDPVSREEIIETLIDNIDEESIIVITTHLVSEIEQFITRAVFINNGQIIGDIDSEYLRDEEGISVDGKYKEVFKNV